MMRRAKAVFSRWADWGAIFVAVLAAIALAITSVVARADLASTSEAMVRGEGQAVLALVHDGLSRRAGFGPPTQADLESELTRLQPSGLRFIAVGPPDRMTATGERKIASTSLVPGQVVIGVERAMLVARMPLAPRRAGPDGALRGPPPDGHPPPDSADRWPLLVIEFEPFVLTRMEAGMTRTVVVGAFSVAVLLAFASVLTARVVRRARDAQQSERARRLAALGEMSSVMAHEIRNPLASLKGNAQLLAEMMLPGSREQVKADLVVHEAQRLERLTQDLLAFVRDGEPVRSEVAPARLLDRALGGLARDRIAFDLGAAPPRLFVDEARLAAALGNLVRNALEASSEGGRVEVRVATSGGEIHVDVRDHGPGITPGEEERIFEPFVTTRVHGTGLGLPVARRAVEQHGGTITARTHPGGGAIFRVILPLGGNAR